MLSKLNRLGRKGRSGVVGSVVWVVLTFVMFFDMAYQPATSSRVGSGSATFDLAEFLGGWIVLGMLPVLIGWGIAWALSADRQ
ncbi:hypothetical protein D893_02257 [Thioalkalivibrio sp. ALE21]|uniref:hypothetical protein n=1 Tax=Thioalkalivibrio sp. ALE21 TaxID=1158175 RepID=UPI000D871C95|nr:hypothetical protein [Thioalkalivibrio sp. ALE21]PYG00751.1 hypothetical protein D893_02257 [Thioalkalivibrio sp. ALE21]